MRARGEKWRVWIGLLAAPTIWFAHFGFVYAAASVEIILAGSAGMLSRAIIVAATLGALAAIAFLGFRAARLAPADEPVKSFWKAVARILAAVSAIGVIYQTVPALTV